MEIDQVKKADKNKQNIFQGVFTNFLYTTAVIRAIIFCETEK